MSNSIATIRKRSMASLVFLSGMFLFVFNVNSQISQATPNVSPSSHIQNTLLGPGVTASNFKYNGSVPNAGNPQTPVQTFVNTNPTFPLTDGILLHTQGAPTISDSDLSAITTNTVTNGVILEFDFIPDGNFLSFNYIFTSGEYTSYTCSSFNDVFGFFISGPGISGPYSNNSKNLAVVPGTNVPVGINTVNSGSAGYNSPSNCAAADPNWQQNSIYFTTGYNTVYNGSGSPFNSYNGSTISMTAETQVICGETYHIKLAISNVGDQALNSGVFIEGGSFSSQAAVDVIGASTSASALSDTMMIEGCETGTFCFERDISVATEEVTIHFFLQGSATRNVDYTLSGLPNDGDSITLAVGETQLCFDIEPILDNITEGLENVVLAAYFINACGDTTYNVAELWIYDKPDPPQPVAAPDMVVCNGATGSLYGTLSNPANTLGWTFDGPGTANFAPNATNLFPSVSFNDVGSYKFYLTEYNDTCLMSGVDSLVVMYGIVDIIVSNDTTICQNGSVTLTAEGSGGQTMTYHWGHTANTGPEQVVNPLSATTYSVYVETEDGCISPTETITVNLHPPLSVVSSPWQSICPGDSATLWAVGSGGIGAPYNYVWTNPSGNVIGNGDTIVIHPNVTAIYTVTVTDGCETSPATSTSEVVFDALPPILFSATENRLCQPAVFQLNNNSNMTLIDHIVWNISNGDTYYDQGTAYAPIDPVGYYDVEMVVTTPNGCRDSLTLSHFLEVVPPPTADFTYHPRIVYDLNPEVMLQNASSSDVIDFQWFMPDGSPSYSDEQFPYTTFPLGYTGTYPVQLIVTSNLGCTDTIVKLVEVLPHVQLYAPNTFTPDGDDFNEKWFVHLQGIDVNNVTILIYNRWGEIIWESHDFSYGWDGTYGEGGKKVKEGTYIWKVVAFDKENDDKYEWAGHVNVLR